MGFPSWDDFTKALGRLRQKVDKDIRKFKQDHPRLSKAIEISLDGLPWPLKAIAKHIYKGSEGSEKEKYVAVLDYLDRLESQGEAHYNQVVLELDKLHLEIDDIREITAKESTIQKMQEILISSGEALKEKLDLLKNEIDLVLRKMWEQELLEANLHLVTAHTEFPSGNPSCWRQGYLTLADVKCGYDARRPITDKIMKGIEEEIGLVLYGKSFSGKSMILKRVMFEEIERGYAVLYGDGVVAKANRLRSLIRDIAKNYPYVLVIADNVHKKGSEELFKTFNSFDDASDVRFLFAARVREFISAKKAMDRDDAAAVDTALNRMRKLTVSFDLDEAGPFLKRAVSVSGKETDISDMELEAMARDYYNYYEGDLLLFFHAVLMYLAEDKTSPRNFLARDLNEKTNALGSDDVLWRAALLCSFMGIYGIRLSIDLLERCKVYVDNLQSLSDKNLLFIDAESETKHVYKVRHEKWALEFLTHVYKEKFGNDFPSFDSKYGVGALIQSMLNEIERDDLYNILDRSANLVQDERYMPLCSIVIEDLERSERPDHEKWDLNEKVELLRRGWASYYLKLDDYETAVSYLEKATKINPQDANLLALCGSIMYEYGRTAAAIPYFERALEIDSENGFALEGMGFSLNLLERYEEAISCFDRLLDAHPISDSDLSLSLYHQRFTYVYRSCSLIGLGRYEEARSILDQSLKIDPKNVRALVTKVYLYTQLGEYEEAKANLYRVLELDPENIEAFVANAELLQDSGQHEEAIRNLDRALEIDSNYVNALIAKADSLYELKKYDDAISEISNALRIDPNNLRALMGKGTYLLDPALKIPGLTRTQLYEEAASCIDRALEIDPKNPFILTTRGLALRVLGKYEEAEKSFDRALEIDPERLLALKNKAYSHQRRRQHEEAIQYLERVLELDSMDLEALVAMGRSLILLDKSEKAIPYFDRVLEADPKNIEILLDRAISLKLLGEYETAKADLNKVLELDSENIEAFMAKAELHLELGQHEEAIQYYDRALEIDSGHTLTSETRANALYNMSCVKALQGHSDESLRLLGQATNLDPKVKELAKKDEDFEELRGDRRFRELVD